ncbi:inscuteable [Holotrichia oblita]|uniref:Inscuteable n=1 Tax=Holotrichia oblita TaxID=644536 RepID=A0ACB9SZ94_HOLOL|nr:inscuteable [Holotrichia oblita]
MSGFTRSPSKVFWGSDENSWNHRATSSSPGSQDSGFSDAEASPSAKPRTKTPQKLDILKNKSSENIQNLSRNIVDKVTPKKQILLKENDPKESEESRLKTPARKLEIEVKSEPQIGRFKYAKNYPKASKRNLFRSIQQIDISTHGSTERRRHQYARNGADHVQDTGDINNEVTYDENNFQSSIDNITGSPHCRNVTVPLVRNRRNRVGKKIAFNITAPAVLNEDEELVTSFTSSSTPSYSDSDSELECLFAETIESPRHTSTPKFSGKRRTAFKTERRHVMNLLVKYQNERVPPITIQNVEDGTALKRWMQEARQLYEPECMTTLQCKSISAELAEKVSHLAAVATSTLRELLNHIQMIEAEFDNLKNQKKHIQPLAQSLAGLVKEFVEKYDAIQDKNLLEQCEDLRKANTEELEKVIGNIHMNWRTMNQTLLSKEIKKIVDGLEDPISEMDVRAKLIGLTSVTLRHENIVDLLPSSGVIQILIVLCEKCEGSSVRALALRALSTICCTSKAIRQFERGSGVQLIAETLADDTRPEPERAEAIALLAQITAPWIEDNHTIRGLQDHTKSLVKSLTRFLHSTKCCQNLLLCAAALANLTAMDSKSIKYILHQNTVKIALETTRRRGPLASIYLLEQVATLIANVSSMEFARKQLSEDEAPKALLCFLQTSSMEEEVMKRLQQKSIIALSRLCSEAEAAGQVVEMDGVEKLVKLCRERTERYNSDAVLVATLATLRKIAEACGASVINEQDAQELVEPRLLDSFLAYSTQNESLV